MAGKRILTRLDPVLHEEVADAARACGVSVSHMVRRLLRLGLDSVEDEYWARVGEEHLATWDGSKALTHEQVWKQEKT